MRFDIDQAITQRQRQTEAARVEAAARAMVDHPVEARLIAALLCDSAVDNSPPPPGEPWLGGPPYPTTSALVLCDGLEVDDFADLRHVAVMQAIRDLQNRTGLVVPWANCDGPWTVAEEIKRKDRDRDKHVSDTVSLVFLVDIVLRENSASVVWIEYAMAHLRDLANVRRLA